MTVVEIELVSLSTLSCNIINHRTVEGNEDKIYCAPPTEIARCVLRDNMESGVRKRYYYHYALETGEILLSTNDCLTKSEYNEMTKDLYSLIRYSSKHDHLEFVQVME